MSTARIWRPLCHAGRSRFEHKTGYGAPRPPEAAGRPEDVDSKGAHRVRDRRRTKWVGTITEVAIE